MAWPRFWHNNSKLTSSFGPNKELMLEKQKLIQMANAVGLEVIRELPAGEYHYAYIFGK